MIAAFFNCNNIEKEVIDHVELIRYKEKQIDWNRDIRPDSFFVDRIIRKYLEKPEHIKYISDRSVLRKLENRICWDNNYILIKDTLDNGDKIEIKIEKGDFEPEKHRLEYSEGNSRYLKTVDSRYPYGALNSVHPSKEIKTLSIRINKEEVSIPSSAFQNLYAANFCNFDRFTRIPEAYIHNQNVYIYIYGGGASDVYFAKLIFSLYKYETSIIVDYGELSPAASFGGYFIGF